MQLTFANDFRVHYPSVEVGVIGLSRLAAASPRLRAVHDASSITVPPAGASAGSCVTAAPADRISAPLRNTSSRTCPRSAASSLENGSSGAQSLRASEQRPHQRHARRLSAGQGGRVATGKSPDNPTSTSAASTAWRRAARPFTAGSRPISRLPATERCGSSSASWKRSPMPRLSGGSAVTSRPFRMMRPSAWKSVR